MRRIFIDNQPRELFQNDKTAPFYEERCINASRACDIVITTEIIDPEYILYLKTLGIEVARDRRTPAFKNGDLASSILCDCGLMNYLAEKTKQNKYFIETFIPNKELAKISNTLNVPLRFATEVYDKYSHKRGFLELCSLLAYSDDSASRFRRKSPPCSDAKRQGVPIDSATPGRSVATLVF